MAPMVLLLVLHGYAGSALPTPVFESTTEKLGAGMVVPPQAMLDAIWPGFSPEELAMVDECRTDQALPASRAPEYFRMASLPPDGRLVFVRGALEPYCNALYGAHVFTFWLLQRTDAEPPRYRLLLSASADDAALLPSARADGLDLLLTHCTGYGCDRALSEWTGEGWRRTRCFAQLVDDGFREVDCAGGH